MRRATILACAAALMLTAPVSSAVADTQYVYDSAGRLIKVTYSNGVVIEYRYDASGNRRQVVTQQIPNQAPNANNDAASVAASSVTDIAVLANDTDPENHTLSITAVSTPTGGTAVILSGPPRIRYTAPSTAGVRTFTYTISDGHGLSDTATVTVTVTASNQPPVAVDDWANTSPGSATPIMVLANDTDPNSNTLTVTAVGTPTGGSVSIGSGGGYVIYSPPFTAGTYSFTYTVSDGAGGSDSGTVQVVVETFEDPCANTPPGQMCEIDP